jgi:predicted dehydrogenase
VSEPQKQQPVRIGFVGVGNMGQVAHLRNYVMREDCRVVALAEVRQDLAQKVARRYGVEKVYGSHREMIEHEKLDAIVAPQMFTSHGTLIPELIRQARIPIFIEKPLARDVENGERIIAALEETRTWVMVGYHKRSDPATEYAKAEIDRVRANGGLGALRYVRVTAPMGDWSAGMMGERLVSTETVPAASDPVTPGLSREGESMHMHLVNGVIHQINLLRHLMGEPYRALFTDRNLRTLVAEGTTSKLTGLIEMYPYVTARDWQEPVLVAFDRGYVKIDLPAPLAMYRAGRVEIYRDLGDGSTPQVIIPHLPPLHAMANQVTNFLKAVRGEAPPPCEAREAIEDLRVARDYLHMWMKQQ